MMAAVLVGSEHVLDARRRAELHDAEGEGGMDGRRGFLDLPTGREHRATKVTTSCEFTASHTQAGSAGSHTQIGFALQEAGLSCTMHESLFPSRRQMCLVAMSGSFVMEHTMRTWSAACDDGLAHPMYIIHHFRVSAQALVTRAIMPW